VPAVVGDDRGVGPRGVRRHAWGQARRRRSTAAITNAQYRELVEAIRHRAPESWSGRRFSDPSQPVLPRSGRATLRRPAGRRHGGVALDFSLDGIPSVVVPARA
jgi:hypothetical protein